MAVNTITGTTGNDLLQGQQLSGTQNQINGLAGNDTLVAATVADSLNGGAGNDSLSFGTGLTINGAALVGGLGNDSFYANGTTLLAASFEGKSGADLFSFTAATNISSTSVRGGEGNDTIAVQTGVVVSYNGFVATLGQGSDVFTVGTGAVSTNVQVYGGKNNDSLTLGGTYNAASIGANEGADRLFLQGASVTLTNSLIGLGQGHDVISTTAANSQVVSTIGTIVGGKGSDTISLNNLSALSNFQIWGDVLAENGDSTIGLADSIILSANSAGGAGIYASVYGGEGNDTIQFLNITGGAGTGAAINFFGGQGNDSIALAGSVDAAGQASTLRGGAGNDTLLANFQFSATNMLFSGLNMNGGAGVDKVIFNTTAQDFYGLAASHTAISGGASFGGSVLGSFSDAGDNLVLQGIGANGDTYSAINAINSGAQVVATALGANVASNTGKFFYNITGGFSSIAAGTSGFGLGSINIFEANGDTVLQVLGAVGTGTTAGFGAGISGADSAWSMTFNLSGNLGVMDNTTAGYLQATAVGLTISVGNDATLGRNGFVFTIS